MKLFRLLLKFFTPKKKYKIKMVNEEDLERYLSSIGILESIKKGEMHCKFCGTKITLKNLQVIYPYNNKIYLICSRKKCLERL